MEKLELKPLTFRNFVELAVMSSAIVNMATPCSSWSSKFNDPGLSSSQTSTRIWSEKVAEKIQGALFLKKQSNHFQGGSASVLAAIRTCYNYVVFVKGQPLFALPFGFLQSGNPTWCRSPTLAPVCLESFPCDQLQFPSHCPPQQPAVQKDRFCYLCPCLPARLFHRIIEWRQIDRKW